MTRFLFEILSEEIPADLQKKGANFLHQSFEKYCAESGISIEHYQIFYSSQRIAIICNLIIEKQEIITCIRGPRIGADDKALRSFLLSQKKQNYKQIEIENKYHGLEYRDMLNKDEEAIEANLSQICCKTLQNFVWDDATMTWKSFLPRWIRPVRSILCLLDRKIINFEFAGIKSSNTTHGHKILTGWKKIIINNCEEYENKLKNGLVIIDPNIRNALITENIKNVDFSDNNINILIDELSCIAEYPMIITLAIEDEFLSLPDDLIKYIMITHQRYIPQVKNEKLSDQYYVVIDHNNPNTTMESGYRRVLNARLSDGKFYWDLFINTDLETLVENLKTTKSEYIPDLSIYDFNKKISHIFINHDEILKILNILSCDLSSNLITEYPALRGIMAYEYIIKNNILSFGEYLQNTINNNIYSYESELYRRETPSNSFERVIVFAKNMLKAQYFIIDKQEKPTSSRDPFQIRKAIENSIYDFFNEFFNQKDEQNNQYLSQDNLLIEKDNEAFNNIFLDVLLNFYYKNEEKFHSKSHIIEIGFHYFTRKNQLIFNYSEIKKFISNQLIFIQNFCNFQWKEETFQAYKRVTQIYSKKYKDFNMEIDENLIATPEEKDFLRFIESSKNELTFDKMQNIEFQIQISSTINNFFDNIKIEDKDEQIKNNRLAILSTFYHLIENFAPISKLNFIQNS